MRVDAEMERSICTQRGFRESTQSMRFTVIRCTRISNRAIDEYKATGNAKIISDAIDTRVAQSLRNLDRLWLHRPSLRVI